jgi:hypothetical protein
MAIQINAKGQQAVDLDGSSQFVNSCRGCERPKLVLGYVGTIEFPVRGGEEVRYGVRNANFRPALRQFSRDCGLET